MKLSTKVLDTANSRNFFVSLISVLLLSFELNDLNTGADPGQIFDAISSADVGRIISILFVNFLNPILKLIGKSSTWSWSFLKSANFWTQVATAAILGLSIIGIQFPDSAAANLVNSVFSGQFETIMLALVVNVINPLFHFFFKRKESQISTV